MVRHSSSGRRLVLVHEQTWALFVRSTQGKMGMLEMWSTRRRGSTYRAHMPEALPRQIRAVLLIIEGLIHRRGQLGDCGIGLEETRVQTGCYMVTKRGKGAGSW
jgi:hypothetical protein